MGFTLNAAAVQRWAVTRPVRAEYKAGLYNMVNLTKTNKKIHKDCEKSKIAKSEADIGSTVGPGMEIGKKVTFLSYLNEGSSLYTKFRIQQKRVNN